MKIFGKHIISVLMLVLSLVSCEDDEFYTDDYISGGETELAVSISFPAFAPALETRAGGAAGNAIEKIDSLWVVIYKKGENDMWILEKDGKIRITKEMHELEMLPDNAGAVGEVQTESNTGHARFRLRLKNGQYKIYAVANYDLSTIADDDIDTPEKLKSRKLTWDKGNIRNNAEMFGCFTNNKSEIVSNDETVIVTPNRTMHAWLRRAASKLTVAFDTRRLKENIHIYIRSVTVRDIPEECYLGENNTPSREREGISNELITGDTLYFGNTGKNADDYTQWRMLTRETGLWGYRSEKEHIGAVPNDSVGQTFEARRKWEHGEAAYALYFYENMQGEGKDKSQTAPGPGNDNGENKYGIGYPDPKENDENSGWKDNKPYGSYVEVEGYYISNVKGNETRGKIKYRFMLGKDTKKNYDAERNYHYKLTLVFNGRANDADWHIEYAEQILKVSNPRVFNYQGQVFWRDETKKNLGYDFRDYNTITVASYEGDPGNYQEVKISFREKGKTEFTDECDWLSYTVDTVNSTESEKVLKFAAEVNWEEIVIDDSLKVATSKGSEASPCNLADPKRSSSDIICTANCYMVDAPGYYMFPLVYGNAIHNGVKNINSYTYTGGYIDEDSTKIENILPVFKNHRDSLITNPYIQKNKGCVPASASLVWQDEQNLITQIKYDATAYGETGGIKFYIAPENIQQGNAVIAVKDTAGIIMWSWHIWVTSFGWLENGDKTITVTGHETHRKFDLMPVNLGWCSGHKDTIRYYKGRECEVKFTAGELEKTITIVQKSHIAFPIGNNPDYQWGRKDPFIASNAPWSNKLRYDASGTCLWAHPARLTKDNDFGEGESEEYYASLRPTTREALGRLIQNPDIWHNPPRKPNENPVSSNDKWQSNNKTYANLWEGRPGTDPNAPILKTVYDPCPVGYQVCHYNAFSGFTISGDNITAGETDYWYHVPSDNIREGNPKDGLFEFYTDTTKLQSIIFPETGYRDWDDKGTTYQYGNIGYVWAAGNVRNNDNYSYNFMFSRTAKVEKAPGEIVYGYIYPKNTFYPCDGFPVRPCVNGTHGTDTP